MNKKVLIIFVIFLVIAFLVAIYILKNNNKVITDADNEINKNVVSDITQNSNNVENNSINGESREITRTIIKINIENKIYTVALEQNETAKEFINMLPQEFNMSELNGNEKYVYLDKKLPTNEYNPKQIEAGDIMIYGNNRLVIFYKSFDTSYRYTKIGHIENLNNLGSENVFVKFEK